MAPSTQAPPLLHPIPSACERLGIKRTSLYQEIRSGNLRAVKLGRRTLIPEAELVRFAEQLSATG